MFAIELLGTVANLETALDMLARLSGGRTRTPRETPEESRLYKLFAGLPDNPDRNVLLWLLEITLQVTAPAYFWRQIAQFDLEIFNLRRQDLAERDRLLTDEDFEGPVAPEKLAILNNYIRDGQADVALELLPPNFIRKGLVKASYRTLGEIYKTRRSATSDHWPEFVAFLITLPYTDLITIDH